MNPFGITVGNVRLLLEGGISLKEDDCVEECIRFISQNLTVHNCIPYFTLAVEKCEGLRKAVLPFLIHNIREIGTREEFQHLKPHEIHSLVPQKGVQEGWGPKSVSELLLSIYNWMKIDEQVRLEDFVGISKKFPLIVVEPEVLRKIYAEDETLWEEPDCKGLYLMAIEKKFFEGRQGQERICIGKSVRNAKGSAQPDAVKEGSGKSSRSSCISAGTGITGKKNSILNRRQDRTRRRTVDGRHRKSSTAEATREVRGTRSKSIDVTKVAAGSKDSPPEAKITVISRSGRISRRPNKYEGCCDSSLGVDQGKSKGSGNLGLKRTGEDPTVEVLEAVPVKKKAVTTDATTSPGGATLRNPLALTCQSTKEMSMKMYLVSQKDQSNGHVLLELDLGGCSGGKAKKVVDFPSKEENCLALCHHSGMIYAICAKPVGNRVSTSEEVIRGLDLDGKKWTTKIPMSKARFQFGWTLAADSIYVLGGTRKNGTLSAVVQRIPIGITSGSVIKPASVVGTMSRPRCDHAVGLLRASIYIVGGLVVGKDGIRLTASMEVFNPTKVTRSAREPMPTKRRCLCVAVVDSRLYAIGGCDSEKDDTEIRTVEVYNPDCDSWTAAPPLVQARRNAYAFVTPGTIFVVGGNRGTPTMEMYNVQNEKWVMFEDRHLLPTGCSNFATFAKG